MPAVFPLPAPLPALLPGGGSGPAYAYTVVSQWSAVGGAGTPCVVPVSNTPGNMLVVFAGWSSGYPESVNAVSNVADDANDWWRHLGTSSVAGVGRCSIWACPSTRPGPGGNGGASVVSVATSWFVAGIAALVAEIAGAPQFAVPDFTYSAWDESTTLTLSDTASEPDLALAVCMGSDYGVTITGPGSGWNDLNQVTLDGYNVNDGDVVLAPAWQAVGAGAVSAAYTAGEDEALAGVMVGIYAHPGTPEQVNPNWPQLHIEMALGYQPGDPQTIPEWTDITTRAIDAAGSAPVKTRRGRSYELTQPEAGEVAVKLNNSDGAFTPGNTASPYYPDVALEVPVRVYAYWSGGFYALGQGYTERLPQAWPDLPQYGFTPLVATDGLGVLANSALPSALAGDYLINSPYAYFPCSEEYATGAQVADEVYGDENTGAAGLTLANLSRTNVSPATCMNGIARLGTYPSGSGLVYYFLETGLSLGLTSAVANSPTGIVGAALLSGLLGDPGGGIGISVLPDAATGPGWSASAGLFTGPGGLYTDPGLPPLTGVVTFTWWFIIAAGLPEGFLQHMLRVEGNPWNYYAPSVLGALRLAVYYTGTDVKVEVGDDLGNTDVVISYATTLSDGDPHFYAVTCTSDEGIYELALFIDGTSVATGTSSGVTDSGTGSRLCLGTPMSSYGGVFTTWNYTIGHVAVFPAILPASRISSFYESGANAWTNDSAPERFTRILNWSGYGLARAVDLGSQSPVFGPADQVQGQSATAACYTVAQTDNGMLYCDAAGNVTYRSRAALYNRPVKWWFGDAPVSQGPLNANPYFQSATAPWTAVNSATLALSNAWSYTGEFALQVTGNGAAANPGAQSELIPVTAGVTYQVSGFCYSPQGWADGVWFTLSLYTAADVLVGVVDGTILPVHAEAQMTVPALTVTIPEGESVTQARVTAGMTGTPASSVQMLFQPVLFYCAEVPMEKGSTFGYDNTFLWNLLTAQQQVNSAYDGSSATAIDTTSQEEYFTRGGSSASIDQTLETTSYQDVLDDVNWSLAKYDQPQLRMKSIVIDAASKANAIPVWTTVLGIEQGDIAFAVRRPIGGAVISETGIVQKVQHDIGPDKWTTTILVSPYQPANAVLAADSADMIGDFAIPW
jgi:hypothetical protein